MTITRAFGLTLDTKTGAVERWAAGEPASVAGHLDAARERMQSASVPTLAQIRDKLGPLADAEVLGIVKPRPVAAARARLESTRPETEEHWCELCGDSLTTLQHDAAIGWYRNCGQCGSDYQGAAERGKA